MVWCDKIGYITESAHDRGGNGVPRLVPLPLASAEARRLALALNDCRKEAPRGPRRLAAMALWALLIACTGLPPATN